MANQSNIIVYDLETGGFTPGVHGVCEVAMIALDMGSLQEIGRYEAIIQPYSTLEGQPLKYEDSAFKVNGLSLNKITKAGKPAKEVAKEIAQFARSMKNGTKKPILAGHNIDKFDNPHLDDFMYNNKIDVTKFFENDSIDTLKWARFKWAGDPEMTKFNLGVCCNKLGIRLIDAHSAMPDTEANAKLLIQFLKSLRGDGSVELLEEDRYRDTHKFSF